MRRPTLLITRPADSAERFADQTRALGFDPILAPMLTIKLTQPQKLCLNGIQAILITSRHGAAALVRATERRDVPVLAVGDATASAAQGFGFTDVQSAGGDGVALASLAAHRLNAANGAVLHVSGDKQAFDVVGALCQQGFDARLRLLYSGTP
ncbi:MAG: uroporphyrinogen-III synthase, partial [Alphaproteobacteria bacterium]